MSTKIFAHAVPAAVVEMPDRQGPDAPRYARDADADLIEARIWINTMIPTEGSVMVTITPALTRACLERNSKNRALSKGKLMDLCRQHREGKLLRTTDHIGFDTDGVLINGQHRLTVVKITGIPLRAPIEFGVPPESRGVTDRGKMRSGADMLAMEGYRNTNQLASAVQWAKRLRENDMADTNKDFLTPQETLDTLDEFPNLGHSLSGSHQFAERYRISRALAAALHWHIAQHGGAAAADLFFRSTVDQLGVHGADDPRFVLSRRMIDNAAKRRINRSGPKELAAVTIKAWNAHIRGRKIRMLRFLPDEAFPEILGPRKGGSPEC